jgi:hypothetical protein
MFVDVGPVALIPVLPEMPIAGLSRGDRVWLRGELRSLKCPGERYAMIFVTPKHFDVVKRGGKRNG